MKELGNFFNHPVYLCTSDITHFLHSAHASASKPDHKLMQRNACKKYPRNGNCVLGNGDSFKSSFI